MSVSSVRGGENVDSGVVLTAGDVTWFEPGTLPPRRSRGLNALQQAVGLSAARAIQTVDGKDGTVTLGDHEFSRTEFEIVTAMTPDEVLRMQEFYESAAVAYLRSWTVRRVVDQAVVDMPAPTTVDGLLDLPPETYEDLLAEATRLVNAAREVQAGFTPEGAVDPDSPTVASTH